MAVVTAPQVANRPDASLTLSKAVTRAAEHLGITRVLLARILGVSAPTVTRLCSGSYRLDERRKEWEFALLFVRAFRSLDSIVGDEQPRARGSAVKTARSMPAPST